MKEKVGIFHPGEMGISIAASARNSGHTVFWVSEGRLPQTPQWDFGAHPVVHGVGEEVHCTHYNVGMLIQSSSTTWL